MTTLAIDKWREKGLDPKLETQAQEIADRMRPRHGDRTLMYPLWLGYLEGSVAAALARPRWANRDRLAVDLRVIEILAGR